MNNPYNNNELNFEQNKAQKYKALSTALSAECALLPNVLSMSVSTYDGNRVDNLWGMIKELHSAIMSLEWQKFEPGQIITQVTPPPSPTAVIDD